MGIVIKHPASGRVKPSFAILTSGHSDTQPWALECPDVKNYKWRSGAWCSIYSCTHNGNSGRQRVNPLHTRCLVCHRIVVFYEIVFAYFSTATVSNRQSRLFFVPRAMFIAMSSTRLSVCQTLVLCKKWRDFRPICRYISKMVRDRGIVTIVN